MNTTALNKVLLFGVIKSISSTSLLATVPLRLAPDSKFSVNLYPFALYLAIAVGRSPLIETPSNDWENALIDKNVNNAKNKFFIFDCFFLIKNYLFYYLF